MRLGLYTILDSKAGIYFAPFTARQHGEAMRSFSDSANGQDGIGAHPEDYNLYHIGYFDSETGEIEVVPSESLGKAIDLVLPKAAN